MNEFIGSSKALSRDGMASASDGLAVGPAEIWTVLQVETKGCGFLSDRRPLILFERHVFSRLTSRQFDVSDVSNPEPGGYGPTGAHQYDRLANAIQFHRTAALQSASWGLPQIMGENFALAGFKDVESMVSAMSDSEDAQIAAFTAFLKAKRLDQCLQSHNWTQFAKIYNGPNFGINEYDTKLASNFQKLSAGPLPDLGVRTAQLYLTYLGFHPGAVDGILGQNTRNALNAFQQLHGLSQSGQADDATVAALTAAASA